MINKERLKICANCKEQYICRSDKVKTSRFCNKLCNTRYIAKERERKRHEEWVRESKAEYLPKMRKAFEKFFDKGDGCWIWKGADSARKHKKTVVYGKFTFRGKSYIAHRASYEIYIGEIPEGKIVLHTCDQGLCVNYLHLYAGTYLENQADKRARGRCKGEKLTEDQVVEIKKELKLHEQQKSRKGKYSMHQIGKRFGVSTQTIIQIRDKKSWAWINID